MKLTQCSVCKKTVPQIYVVKYTHLNIRSARMCPICAQNRGAKERKDFSWKFTRQTDIVRYNKFIAWISKQNEV